MKIQTKNEQGIERIELEGDLDFHSSTELREALAKPAGHEAAKILVDLKKVNYIDSSGLAAFVELFQKSKRYGAKLVLCNPSPGVKSVFEISKLNTPFKLTESETEALAYLS